MDAYQHFSDHLCTDILGLWSTCGYHIPWNHFHISHLYRFQASKSQMVNDFQGSDQIIIQADFEGCFFQTILGQITGKGNHFLVFHLDKRVFSYSVRHLECFLSCKCLFHNQSAFFLVIFYIRIHYLIQNGPHIESKLNCIRICSRHRKIAAVFDMGLCHHIKQMGCRIFRKYIYHARINTQTDNCHLSFFFPLLMPVKIIFCHRFRIAVFNSKPIGRLFHRNRPGSHIGIIGPCFISCIKNIIAGKGRCRIHDKINLVLPDQTFHLLLVRCINLNR